MQALIVVDMQNDFISGSLAVPGAQSLVQKINLLVQKTYEQDPACLFIYTQDWHPPCHISFAETHALQPFQSIETEKGSIDLWPVHCVSNTWGAQLHRNLKVPKGSFLVKKGSDPARDSYSGFGSQQSATQLEAILKHKNITRITVVGLAFEYCVQATALAAVSRDLRVIVLQNLCRWLSQQSHQRASLFMQSKGIQLK